MTTNALPSLSAFDSQGPSYLNSWRSPQALSPSARDYVYNVVAGTSSANASGLGITNSFQYSPNHSTVSQAHYAGPEFFGQRQSMVQSSLPPTPQTGGLPPEGSFRPQQPSPVLPRPPSSRQSRQSRQNKRLRPKGGALEDQPGLKRRRSSSTSQASQPQPYPTPQAIHPEARAEMERKKQFFEGLRSKGVPWKDIVKQYEIEYGKSMTQAALQMERKRVRDSLRVWMDSDVEALKSAHEYYETHKFSIIAEKMAELGAEENWSPKQCQKKWEEMSQVPQDAAASAAATPIPQPIPVRRAPAVPAPERWMQQGYDAATTTTTTTASTTATSSSRVTPVSASTTAMSPNPFTHPSDAFNSYQQ